MKSFYEEWLKKNRLENEEALKNRRLHQMNTPTTTTTTTTTTAMPTTQVHTLLTPVSTITTTTAIPNVPTSAATTSATQVHTSVTPVSILTTNPTPSTSAAGSASHSDIMFQKDNLQLFVQKAALQRQKKFKLSDHHFHLKIKLKNDNEPLPFLREIMEFLQEALVHVMKNIKLFYNEKDANLGFITLFQEPMITALNSGS